jgi:hypothetical protein
MMWLYCIVAMDWRVAAERSVRRSDAALCVCRDISPGLAGDPAAMPEAVRQRQFCSAKRPCPDDHMLEFSGNGHFIGGLRERFVDGPWPWPSIVQLHANKTDYLRKATCTFSRFRRQGSVANS